METRSYFFVFGRTPLLALKELVTIYPSATQVIDTVAQVDSGEIDAQKLIGTLGGTVKIALFCGRVDTLDGTLSSFIADGPNHITFGVSVYGEAVLPKGLLSEIKTDLESQGIQARYLTSRDDKPLSSVSIDKQHAVELIVVKQGEHFLVGKTIAVQSYDEWSDRDYNRPYSDAKSGMLPPKIARMIVALALPESNDNRQKTLFDPFCGMGTIIAEGYLMGHRVIGCDSSERAIRGAQENIKWLMKQYPESKGAFAKLFVGDAVHVSEILPRESVHAIVTEPFMGSTRWGQQHSKRDGEADRRPMTPAEITSLKNTIKGLEKLYIGCLRDWRAILVPGGKIVIALPAYAISGKTYFVKKVVDMCENLGYTIVDGPIEYSRPQATVKRLFYIFQKK